MNRTAQILSLARAYGTHSGTVKWFNAQKGFGFIVDKQGRDVFVHQADIKAEGYRFLNDQEAVEFDVDETNRGPQARNVTGPSGGSLTRPMRRPLQPRQPSPTKGKGPADAQAAPASDSA